MCLGLALLRGRSRDRLRIRQAPGRGQAPVGRSALAPTLVCAKALRVVPGRFDSNQHRPTQPLPQTRRYTPRKERCRANLRRRPQRLLDSRTFTQRPTPALRAITLTVSMPDHPVNINSARPTARRRNCFMRNVLYGRQSASRGRSRGRVAAGQRRPEPGRECHVHAIRPAYDDAMSKMARSVATRSVVTGARVRGSPACRTHSH